MQEAVPGDVDVAESIWHPLSAYDDGADAAADYWTAGSPPQHASANQRTVPFMVDSSLYSPLHCLV